MLQLQRGDRLWSRDLESVWLQLRNFTCSNNLNYSQIMSSGKSLSLRQNAFAKPPDEDVVEDQDGSGLKRDKRFANVYDCVAGLSIVSLWLI